MRRLKHKVGNRWSLDSNVGSLATWFVLSATVLYYAALQVIGEMSTETKTSFDSCFNREGNTKKMNRETNKNKHEKKVETHKSNQISLSTKCRKHARTSSLQVLT